MELWCGDETLAQKYHEVERKGPPANMKMSYDSEASAFERVDVGFTYLEPLAQMVGNVAIVKINGGLVSGSAGWKRLFGYTGYEEIKGALVEAASRPDVEGILLYCDSPGGSTNGLVSTGKLIKEISKVKPVTSFAAQACSAAYWLASAGEHITTEPTSFIGSIGAIMQLVDETAYNEKQGFKVNIFKSGSLKMAGNPNEEMSEEAKANFQQIVDDTASVFYKTVADNRGFSYETVKERFGDARTMMGGRALAEGLVDSMDSLGAAVTDLQNRVSKKGSPFAV